MDLRLGGLQPGQEVLAFLWNLYVEAVSGLGAAQGHAMLAVGNDCHTMGISHHACLIASPFSPHL